MSESNLQVSYTSESNLQVSRRMLEGAFGQGQVALVDEFVAADAVDHDPANPEGVRGPAGIKEQISMYRAAFPDLEFTIEDTVAQDDRVVIRWSSRGTHQGELMGLAPTGKVVSVTGISIDRLRRARLSSPGQIGMCSDSCASSVRPRPPGALARRSASNCNG